ncbi:helix-turn-helix transcriptional regulator [Anoxybacillus kestanbolensis]|uniref:helix-turn-helix transcriptional regulator n=1 Tax=Anoxybacillus kestanbolensis TaxID=227476 RepID=UPI003D1AC5E7
MNFREGETIKGVFRNRIKYWIKDKGLIQKRVAEKMGVSEQTFHKWCKNVTQPNLEEAYVLSRIIGVSLEELCEFEEDKEK